MDEQQLQQQIVQLVQAAMQGDQQANQQIQQIMQAAQQGDQQAAQIAQYIQQVAQQMQGGQAQSARFGAKLNYIKYLKGQCPEGFEMQSFKKGGAICKKCVKKNQEGSQMEDPVKSFKCGRKIKKGQQGLDAQRFKQIAREKQAIKEKNERDRQQIQNKNKSFADSVRNQIQKQVKSKGYLKNFGKGIDLRTIEKNY